MSEIAGILTAGENSIALAKRPTKIISVTAGGKALEETELAFAIHKADALQNPHRRRPGGIGVGGQFAAKYGI